MPTHPFQHQENVSLKVVAGNKDLAAATGNGQLERRLLFGWAMQACAAYLLPPGANGRGTKPHGSRA